MRGGGLTRRGLTGWGRKIDVFRKLFTVICEVGLYTRRIAHQSINNGALATYNDLTLKASPVIID